MRSLVLELNMQTWDAAATCSQQLHIASRLQQLSQHSTQVACRAAASWPTVCGALRQAGTTPVYIRYGVDSEHNSAHN
jgi:hypothetical protein